MAAVQPEPWLRALITNKDMQYTNTIRLTQQNKDQAVSSESNLTHKQAYMNFFKNVEANSKL
jgi:hypothetical protein